MLRRPLRRLAAATATASVGTAAVLYANDDTTTAGARAFRTFYYAARVGYDWKYGEAATLPAGSEERKKAAAEAHQRAADRLLRVCLAHGGLYVKLGQFVSSMNHVLPPAYPETLAKCQDSAEPVGFSAVRGVVEAELGVPLEDAFASFEPEPIAAASLAQVHRAFTADGQRVACKVQYPTLARQVAADLATLRLLVPLVGFFFPQHGYEWLLPEFEETILDELDFRREAQNAARTAAFFANEPSVGPSVHVPSTLPHLSGERVLTMEFIDGVKVSDADGLAALRLHRPDVARLVAVAFSAMIFSHGHVHCDPHAGNLLVRTLATDTPGDDAYASASGVRSRFGRLWRFRAPPPRAQLVLLDHGMYRELGESFRKHYCELWVALLTRDDARGRAAAAALGVPDADFDALSLVLTFRPAASRTAIGARMGQAERAALRQKYGELSAADVNRFLERLPRDMLFVMRTWALVRSLNRHLGGTTRERLLVLAEYAAAGNDAGTQAADGAHAKSGGRRHARARALRLRMRLLVRCVDYVGRLASSLAMLRAMLIEGVAELGRSVGAWLLTRAPPERRLASGTPQQGAAPTLAGAPSMGARLTAPVAAKNERLRELG